MLILNNDDVSKVLDMRLCLSALESVFQELAVGDATGMGRIDLYVLLTSAALPIIAGR